MIALRSAELLPRDVDYLNAHATSTKLGDAAENAAIRRVFGKHATQHALSISSTKGAVGHMLGAAGAIEAAFAILALHHDVVPPTLNLDTPDTGFDFDSTPRRARHDKLVNVSMTNSFGFGGTNASLLFGKYD
jgi:3-oxoacyl-[acyl-carrier-protein] synthase II